MRNRLTSISFAVEEETNGLDSQSHPPCCRARQWRQTRRGCLYICIYLIYPYAERKKNTTIFPFPVSCRHPKGPKGMRVWCTHASGIYPSPFRHRDSFIAK
ncbi:hypothetical protein VTH06DRAFT_3383 [Thermothelomyces fergusii]